MGIIVELKKHVYAISDDEYDNVFVVTKVKKLPNRQLLVEDIRVSTDTNLAKVKRLIKTRKYDSFMTIDEYRNM